MRVAILGCGNRGADVYARHLSAQGASITHLVDPNPARLAQVAARFPHAQTLSHPDEFFALGKVADAVVIATPDDQHVAPALAALALDYDILLEKPICLEEHELALLLQAEAASRGRVTVCHMLRYSPFFEAVFGVLASGRLGQLIGVQHSENVAYWHYAHSFVRGNWRAGPAPFLLAKSCHDLDLLRAFAGAAPLRVSSSGGLHHFTPQHAPAGAATRCLDCAVACPYNAVTFYNSRPHDTWPNTVLTAGGLTVAEALATGPYGECVYLGKNSVLDHQNVLVEFENGVQAALTVSAFTHNNTRTLKIVGSHGELRGQMELGELEVYDFVTGNLEKITVDAAGNHGGGDERLVAAWLAYLRGESSVPTTLAESLDSHRMAFWAERARAH